MINLFSNDLEWHERYYKLGDTHIFLQVGVDQLNIIKNEIAMKKHQRIHIFELYPTAVMDILKEIISIVQSDTKVIIHISHDMISYKRYMESYFKCIPDKDGSKIKKFYIVPESRIVRFSSMCDMGLLVEFTKDRGGYQLKSYLQRWTWKLPKNYYYFSDSAIQSKIELDNMDLFKDIIIRRFKRCTPIGILSTFLNDDDIWDYIIDEWNIEPNE